MSYSQGGCSLPQIASCPPAFGSYSINNAGPAGSCYSLLVQHFCASDRYSPQEGVHEAVRHSESSPKLSRHVTTALLRTHWEGPPRNHLHHLPSCCPSPLLPERHAFRGAAMAQPCLNGLQDFREKHPLGTFSMSQLHPSLYDFEQSLTETQQITEFSLLPWTQSLSHQVDMTSRMEAHPTDL